MKGKGQNIVSFDEGNENLMEEETNEDVQLGDGSRLRRSERYGNSKIEKTGRNRKNGRR